MRYVSRLIGAALLIGWLLPACCAFVDMLCWFTIGHALILDWTNERIIFATLWSIAGAWLILPLAVELIE